MVYRAVRFTVLSLLLLAAALPASAEVFTVTKTADTLDLVCDHDCSLREAVAAANVTPDPDRVIVLPPGVYALHRVGAGEDGNAFGDLDVLKPILLVGAGPDSTVIDGVASDRVFDLWASADLFGVMIRNGQVAGGGGGILARDRAPRVDVRLHRTSVQGNRADGDGGGFLGEDQARLQMSDSAVVFNEAGGDGGGLSGGYVSLTNVTVSTNIAAGAGGGLFLRSEGSSTLSAVTITQNQAGLSGGGLAGGATTRFTGSIVAGNTASSNEDCSGARSNGYNVIGVTGTCEVLASDLKGRADDAHLEARLGPLTLIGPLLGHPLLPDSPALGLVPAGTCEPADQVGQTRPQPCDAGALERVETSRTCIPGGSTLCLQEGRFRVTASWTQESGLSGAAWAVPLTDDTGVYWFFGPENLELTVKVLNGCAVNNSWWVFSTGLTNVGVTLTVEDLAPSSGFTNRTYTHPAGSTYTPRLDTSAFFTCSEEPAFQGASSARAGFPVLVPTRKGDTAVGSCDHDCSLREAVAAANARQGLDVIVLGPGTYTLDRAGAGEDLAATGDLDVTDHLLILGAGADRTVIDGGGHDRVLDAIGFVQSNLEIHGVTIRNGRTDTDGGGIRSEGAVLLKGSHVTGNQAVRDGGGVFGFTLIARDSTISENVAATGGGATVYGFVDLNNVTISGNRAVHVAGGLRLLSSSTRIAHTTITENRANQIGGIFRVDDEECPFVCGEYSLTHSIVAGNIGGSSPDCFIDAPFSGEGGFNVFGVAEDCDAGTSDRAGTRQNPLDPLLTPLAERGGPTPTHGLQADSPALDLGGNGCLALDQRGRPRPQDGDHDGTAECDAGAFELSPVCEEDGEALCLGDRFRLTVHWATTHREGQGHPHPLTRDTGTFWFFDPANLELTVKVLDGCSVNQRYWVFLSGLTDVEVRVDVEDLVTGAIKTYTHDGNGPFATRLDTDAFSCGDL